MARALILDFGEVLVRPQPAAIVAEMATLAGLEVDEFRRRYWLHRPAYDGGLPADDYWQRVLGDAKGAATDGVLGALKDADARSWTDYRDELWNLTAEFKHRGGRTAFLSNGVPEVMSLVRKQRTLADYFNVVIVSYEIGVTKPDARIYELCLEQLAVPAADCLFVDDRPENLAAANQLGIQTLPFRGDQDTDAVRQWIA